MFSNKISSENYHARQSEAKHFDPQEYGHVCVEEWFP